MAHQNRRVRQLKSQSGGTFISVIIAGFLIVLLTFLAVHVYSRTMNSYSFEQSRQSLINKFEKIRLATVSRESCSQIMTNSPVSISTGATSSMPSLNIGSEVINLGISGSLNVTQINLIGESDLPDTFDSTNQLRRHKRVRLEISGTLTAGGQSLNFDRFFSFDVLTDNSNGVVGCYRGQNSEKVACEVMGGVFNGLAGTCAMPNQGPTTGTCSSGQCIIGFSNSNEVVCGGLTWKN